MKRISQLLALLGAVVVIVGCDWSSGGGADSWNTRWNAFNFNGTYFGAINGMLVTNLAPNPDDLSSSVTGSPIRSVTVHHEGENISMTDNNGGTYTGKLGSLRRSDGTPVVAGEGSGLTEAQHVIAQFTASGTSAAGMPVEIVGTFEALAGGTTLSERVISGTWVEAGGRAGSLLGFAIAIEIEPIFFDPGDND